MERVTISLSKDLAEELTAFMEAHRYGNRSEAIRDLARLGLEKARADAGEEAGDCVGTISYVFNHHTRELSKRLTDLQHGRHDLHVAAMHIHLDHLNCLEVSVLRGPTPAVRDFAREIIAERGVAHGSVSLVPVVIDSGDHAHGAGGHGHEHMRPKS